VRSGPTSLDRFLGGRLLLAQPKKGFRAGHDTVLLAASVPAHAGAQVLELGSGAGVASLCLAARVPGVQVLGIEIDEGLVALANENAARSGMEERVRFEPGDATRDEDVLILSREQNDRVEGFDHVFFNPPFHPATGQPSPNAQRERAMRMEDVALAQWTRAALALVRTGGTVTAIIRADRAEEMLAGERAGERGAVLFPLFPHKGETPKRAIVQIVKGGTAPLRHAAGLVLHERDGRNTDAAEAVLRYGKELRLA
jgi:tRNA1Val (adenine37-N6)-methyltransferase